MTKTIEILTINLLRTINEMEESGWSPRIVVVQGPKALVTFEVQPTGYSLTEVLDAA